MQLAKRVARFRKFAEDILAREPVGIDYATVVPEHPLAEPRYRRRARSRRQVHQIPGVQEGQHLFREYRSLPSASARLVIESLGELRGFCRDTLIVSAAARLCTASGVTLIRRVKGMDNEDFFLRDGRGENYSVCEV